MKDFGKRLESVRMERGLSQSELARQLKLKPQSVQKWENGGLPKIGRIDDIAKALGVNTQWLMYGSGERDITPFDRERVISFIESHIKLLSNSQLKELGGKVTEYTQSNDPN